MRLGLILVGQYGEFYYADVHIHKTGARHDDWLEEILKRKFGLKNGALTIKFETLEEFEAKLQEIFETIKREYVSMLSQDRLEKRLSNILEKYTELLRPYAEGDAEDPLIEEATKMAMEVLFGTPKEKNQGE